MARQPSTGGRRSSVTISSGALPRYSMPSSRKSPETGIRRSPPRADQGDLGAEGPQDRRRVGGGDGPAARAAGRHQADVAVLLHAEADRPAPLVGLVVVVAARVDADVAPERPHVAELGRRDHAGRPREGRVAGGDLGMVRDAGQRRAGAHHACPPARCPGFPPAPGSRGGRPAPAAPSGGASCSDRGRCRRPPPWPRGRARREARPPRPRSAARSTGRAAAASWACPPARHGARSPTAGPIDGTASGP